MGINHDAVCASNGREGRAINPLRSVIGNQGEESAIGTVNMNSSSMSMCQFDNAVKRIKST